MARPRARWRPGRRGRRRRVERDPAWSPDGRQLVFAADHGEGFDLYVVPARGGEPRA